MFVESAFQQQTHQRAASAWLQLLSRSLLLIKSAWHAMRLRCIDMRTVRLAALCAATVAVTSAFFGRHTCTRTHSRRLPAVVGRALKQLILSNPDALPAALRTGRDLDTPMKGVPSALSFSAKAFSLGLLESQDTQQLHDNLHIPCT